MRGTYKPVLVGCIEPKLGLAQRQYAETADQRDIVKVDNIEITRHEPMEFGTINHRLPCLLDQQGRKEPAACFETVNEHTIIG